MAQILLGADQATLFPHAVKDQTGSLLQVNQARLIKSEITGKYIIFGSCGNNKICSGDRYKPDRINQTHEREPHLPSDTTVISRMKSINLNDAKHIETSQTHKN